MSKARLKEFLKAKPPKLRLNIILDDKTAEELDWLLVNFSLNKTDIVKRGIHDFYMLVSEHVEKYGK